MRYKEIFEETEIERFKRIKSPSSRYSTINDDNIQEIFTKYKDVINKTRKTPFTILRGMKDTGKYVLADSSLQKRSAANTHNYINALSEVLPSWKGWPARNDSFICSTENNVADGYGVTYIVIPLENQPIAAANKEDFWYMLPVGLLNGTSVNKFNESIAILFNIVNNTMDDFKVYYQDNPKEIISNLEKIKELSIDTIEDRQRSWLVRSNINNIRIIIEGVKIHGAVAFLDSVLNPNEVGTLFPSYDDYLNSRYTTSSEIWMSGKVLFIRRDTDYEIE
jgi:hypothetical protein